MTTDVKTLGAPLPSLALRKVPVSVTLMASQTMADRMRAGQPVLPLAFGEAGLPVHPALLAALAAAGSRNGYGPVAGDPGLRAAAAGYWQRRGLPTKPAAVVCGPGSKALLFALQMAIGGTVAIPRPSWVSYAAQGTMLGSKPLWVAAAAGEGGICDPAALYVAADDANVRSVVVTLADNPTGRVANPRTVRALCEVAADRSLVIFSDEIYRDLIHDPAASVLSPADVAPERTVVISGLSKSLALGGWRIGVARMPDGPLGRRLRAALLGVASEIWSVPSVPVQHAAALAFNEPPEICERIATSRKLHAAVAHAVADSCRRAGLLSPAPQAGFYLYPDFGPWRGHLRSDHAVTTSTGLAALLLRRYGAATLPGSAFGDHPNRLTLRLATALIYGGNPEQQEAALAAADPLAHPPIAAALNRFDDILSDLGGFAAAAQNGSHRSAAGPVPRPAKTADGEVRAVITRTTRE